MDDRDKSNDKSQKWLELCRVYDGRQRIHWQVECQYIFKTKKQAVVFMEIIDRELSKQSNRKVDG